MPHANGGSGLWSFIKVLATLAVFAGLFDLIRDFFGLIVATILVSAGISVWISDAMITRAIKALNPTNPICPCHDDDVLRQRKERVQAFLAASKQ